MNTRAAASNVAREPAQFALALWQLTKPGVTRMVLVTTWLGAALAPGALQLGPLLLTLVGTLLVVASANCLNMVLEHEVDGLMERTRERPLPSGRLSREVALVFGITLGVVGLLTLLLLVNALTAFWGAFSLVSYVLLYTPLKAKSSSALYVGAVPGAMPPVLGYLGVSGHLTWQALAVFAVLFAWQIPHFLAITLFRRDDYAAAGLQVMSVAYGVNATRIAIVVSSFVLLGVTLLPCAVGLGDTLYFVSALVCGVGFSLWAWLGQRGRDLNRWARSVFFASLPYVVILFGLLAWSAP